IGRTGKSLNRVLRSAPESQPAGWAGIPSNACAKGGFPIAKNVIRETKSGVDVLRMNSGILSGKHDGNRNEAIRSHPLFGEVSADMFEAYASLQGHAMERPLILRKQRAESGAGFDSCSMEAEHGELVRYTVLKPVGKPVIIIETDRRVHVI